MARRDMRVRERCHRFFSSGCKSRLGKRRSAAPRCATRLTSPKRGVERLQLSTRSFCIPAGVHAIVSRKLRKSSHTPRQLRCSTETS
jgi:hypothetical protein